MIGESVWVLYFSILSTRCLKAKPSVLNWKVIRDGKALRRGACWEKITFILDLAASAGEVSHQLKRIFFKFSHRELPCSSLLVFNHLFSLFQFNSDRFIQQLLPDLQSWKQIRSLFGSNSRERPTETTVEAEKSDDNWQEKEGRDKRGMFRF